MAALSLSLLAVWVTSTAVGNRAAPTSDRFKSGSGFFISRDGDLVTSAHVVTGCPSISVWGSDGRQRAGSVLATDDALDIALLRAPGSTTDYARASELIEPSIGTAVFVLGYGVIVSDPRRPVAANGTYLGSDMALNGVRVLAIHARLQRGQSGGPVVDADGGLLGMVMGRVTETPSRGVVLPAGDIQAFLSFQGKHLSIGQADARGAPSKLLPAITVLVQCLPLGTGDGVR